MLNLKTPLQWDELLFGFLYSVATIPEIKPLFGMLSLAARKSVTKKWLKPNAPTLDNWYKLVHSIFVMERITLHNRLQRDKFDEIWQTWKSYILTRRPEYV